MVVVQMLRLQKLTGLQNGRHEVSSNSFTEIQAQVSPRSRLRSAPDCRNWRKLKRCQDKVTVEIIMSKFNVMFVIIKQRGGKVHVAWPQDLAQNPPSFTLKKEKTKEAS